MSSRRHCEPLIAYSEPPLRKMVREMVTSGVIDIERVIGIIDGQAHLCTA